MGKDQIISKGDEEIGKRIRRLRKYMQMTQKELADRVMISSSSITRLESGKIMVSVFTLMEIAEVLKAPISEILMGRIEEGEVGQELSGAAAKLRECSPEQRKALIKGFEQIIDAVFLGENHTGTEK